MKRHYKDENSIRRGGSTIFIGNLRPSHRNRNGNRVFRSAGKRQIDQPQGNDSDKDYDSDYEKA